MTIDGLVWLEPGEWTAWRLRVKAEHLGGNLTPARRDALVALVGLQCAGDTEPTDEAVAALAGCSARTVRRARADARELGLLSWTRTRRLVCGAWRQGPNRYDLRMPASPVCRGGQDGRTRQTRKKDRTQERVRAPFLAVPAGAAEALAAVRARRAVQLGLSVPVVT
jgi:hypothetical protein